jgi:hypothetical protein
VRLPWYQGFSIFLFLYETTLPTLREAGYLLPGRDGVLYELTMAPAHETQEREPRGRLALCMRKRANSLYFIAIVAILVIINPSYW